MTPRGREPEGNRGHRQKAPSSLSISCSPCWGRAGLQPGGVAGRRPSAGHATPVGLGSSVWAPRGSSSSEEALGGMGRKPCQSLAPDLSRKPTMCTS